MPTQPAPLDVQVNPWYALVTTYHGDPRPAARRVFRYSERHSALSAPNCRRVESGHRLLTLCPFVPRVLLLDVPPCDTFKGYTLTLERADP